MKPNECLQKAFSAYEIVLILRIYSDVGQSVNLGIVSLFIMVLFGGCSAKNVIIIYENVYFVVYCG